MSSVVLFDGAEPEWCWQQLPWWPQAFRSNWRKEQNQCEAEMGLGCLSKSAVAALKTDGKWWENIRFQNPRESDSTDRSQRALIITQPLFIHVTFGLIWMFHCVTDKIKGAKIVFVVGKLNCLYIFHVTHLLTIIHQNEACFCECKLWKL